MTKSDSGSPANGIQRRRIGRGTPGLGRPLGRAALAGVFFLLGVILAYRAGALGHVTNTADAVADWLVTRAFLEGADPYQSIQHLSELFGVDYVSPLDPLDPPHPRLPGALIMMTPLVLVDVTTASQVLRILGVVSLLAVVTTIAYRIRLRPVALAGVGLSASVTGAAIWAFAWFTQSSILAGMAVISSFLIYRSRHLLIASALIGLAAILKPFLLILLVPWFRSEYRQPLMAGAGVFVGMNVLVIAFTSVELSEAVSAIRTANKYWFSSGSNISLASWIDRGSAISPWLMIAVHGGILLLFLLYLRRRSASLHQEVSALALLGILISPLSWPHYLLMVLPFLWVSFGSVETPRYSRIMIGIGLAMWIWLQPVWLYTLGTILMFVGVASSIRLPESSSAARLSADGVAA